MGKIILTVGLVAVMSLFYMVMCSGNSSKSKMPSAGPFQPIGLSGPYDYVIDGNPWRVDLSYFLVFSPSEVQYTMEITHHFDEEDAITQSNALKVVAPLMRYAFEHDLYLNGSVMDSQGNRIPPTLIGVVLVDRGGFKSHGIRVNKSIDELREAVEGTN